MAVARQGARQLGGKLLVGLDAQLEVAEAHARLVEHCLHGGGGGELCGPGAPPIHDVMVVPHVDHGHARVDGHHVHIRPVLDVKVQEKVHKQFAQVLRHGRLAVLVGVCVKVGVPLGEVFAEREHGVSVHLVTALQEHVILVAFVLLIQVSPTVIDRHAFELCGLGLRAAEPIAAGVHDARVARAAGHVEVKLHVLPAGALEGVRDNLLNFSHDKGHVIAPNQAVVHLPQQGGHNGVAHGGGGKGQVGALAAAALDTNDHRHRPQAIYTVPQHEHGPADDVHG
mmetsp:Transcript_47751/g.120198  ORF Transcript_47751/g.120198 Transcript_47751/m.120198 type:complete len:283 (+) Transcript_47751:777-1625(+)